LPSDRSKWDRRGDRRHEKRFRAVTFQGKDQGMTRSLRAGNDDRTVRSSAASDEQRG